MKLIVLTLVLAALVSSDSLAQTTAKEWYDKGISLKESENYKEAINAFKKAVALKPAYPQALHQLGWCYNEEEMYREAIDALKKEAKAGPEDESTNFFELGYAYKGLKNYEEALKSFSGAISKDEDYALAYKERGKTYYQLQKYELALDDFVKYEYLEDEIDDASFYYDKGWVENDLEKYSDAVESLKKCIELDDNYTDGYSELGFSYYKMNSNPDAIRNYRVAMNLDPTDYHPVIGIADVYYDNLKDYDSAIVYYEKGVKLQKSNKSALYRLGWCYNDKEKYSLAISPLKEAMILDPAYDEAQIELGYAYYKMEQCDNALAQFRPVITRNAKSDLSRYYAGLCYYKKNDQPSLVKMINELKALDADKYVMELSKYLK